jgi:hypothetical protein
MQERHMSFMHTPHVVCQEKNLLGNSGWAHPIEVPDAGNIAIAKQIPNTP